MFSFVVGASRPKSGLKLATARFAMQFEGCNYSHIHIEFPKGWVTDETGVIYEARNGQVNWCNEETFLKDMIPVRKYLVRCNEEQVQDILDFCWSNSGKSYGYKELIGAAYVTAVEKLTDKTDLKNPFVDGLETEICTGIGTRLLQIVDSDVLRFKYPEALSPKDVVEICDSENFERIM